jgi:hypothetical protein
MVVGGESTIWAAKAADHARIGGSAAPIILSKTPFARSDRPNSHLTVSHHGNLGQTSGIGFGFSRHRRKV